MATQATGGKTQSAQREAGADVIATIIQRLETTIKTFETYEKPLWPDQCEEALSAVRDLQAALRQIPVPTGLIDLAIEAIHTGRDNTAELLLMNTIPHASEQADQTCLLLAAYAPHGRIKAQRHLEPRHVAINQLRELVEAAAKVQPASFAPAQRDRPPYIHVVEPGDQVQRNGE